MSSSYIGQTASEIHPSRRGQTSVRSNSGIIEIKINREQLRLPLLDFISLLAFTSVRPEQIHWNK